MRYVLPNIVVSADVRELQTVNKFIKKWHDLTTVIIEKWA